MLARGCYENTPSISFLVGSKTATILSSQAFLLSLSLRVVLNLSRAKAFVRLQEISFISVWTSSLNVLLGFIYTGFSKMVRGLHPTIYGNFLIMLKFVYYLLNIPYCRRSDLSWQNPRISQ